MSEVGRKKVELAKYLKYQRYLRLQQKGSEEYTETYAKMESIKRAIEKLEDPLQKSILELKYLKGLKLYQISRKLYCGERTINRYHAAALEKIEL